ncbi:MAG: hypothetical protein AB7U23_10085 [Dehalococcoidia bacterium]
MYDWQEIARRAGKTFAQAALAAFVMSLPAGNVTTSALVTAGTAAIAAGVSAAWNTVLTPKLRSVTGQEPPQP